MARKYNASHIVVTIIANIAPAATAVVPVTTNGENPHTSTLCVQVQ